MLRCVLLIGMKHRGQPSVCSLTKKQNGLDGFTKLNPSHESIIWKSLQTSGFRVNEHLDRSEVFSVAPAKEQIMLSGSIFYPNRLNSELCKKALEKVGNPNVLINLISRRVRQLNSAGGALSRPLIADTTGLGAADIALLEIIEDKVGFEMPELVELTRPVGKKRKKH